ncbi:MAG TPA: DUF1648 domain-containing protein [Mycobacteriales bacterium]|nr:DUF1648 domain-containing protein [Mycobacteriales bacterium]
MSRWLRAAAYAVSASAIAVSVLFGVVIWIGVKGDVVPVHWNGNFDPDGYGSKWLGAGLPTLMVLVAVVAMAPIAGVTRPRHHATSLFVVWIGFVGFITALMLATSGQTMTTTGIGRSGWISEAVLATALVTGLAGGAAGYLVAGRTPAEPRRRWVPPPEPPYWFKAKSYGYGWGRPLTWQGWVVMVGYLVAVLVPPLVGAPGLTLVAVLIGTPLLLLACLRHGEPASWRWGRRDT